MEVVSYSQEFINVNGEVEFRTLTVSLMLSYISDIQIYRSILLLLLV